MAQTTKTNIGEYEMKTFKQFILSEGPFIKPKRFKQPKKLHIIYNRKRPLRKLPTNITLKSHAKKTPQKWAPWRSTRPSTRPSTRSSNLPRPPKGTKLLPSLSTRLTGAHGYRKQNVVSAVRDRVKDALHPANVAGKLLGRTAGHVVGSATGASRARMNTISYGYK